MTDLSPYLDKESAILWLSQHLHSNDVDIKTMYHLNIINNLIQNDKEIFRRIPQEVFGGLPEGGRKNVQASVLARAVSCSSGEAAQGIGASGYTRTQEVIGTWAEKDGCWHDYADSYALKQGAKFMTSGSEANIYDKKDFVYKINDITHYQTIDRLLDRIAIHNAIFPETRLEVDGFGMKDDAEDSLGYSVILKQKFIQGNEITDPETAFSSLTKRQLKPLNSSSWCFTTESGNVILHDFHNQNMVIADEGIVMHFDCEAALNTDQRTKGNYIIPKVEGSQESVAAIEKLLNDIAPREIPMNEFARLNPEIAKDLQSGKRIEKPVSINGTSNKVLVSLSKEGTVLVVKPDTVNLMIQNKGITESEKTILSKGKSFIKNGKKYFFNIEKGRLDSVPTTTRKLSSNLKNKI